MNVQPLFVSEILPLHSDKACLRDTWTELITLPLSWFYYYSNHYRAQRTSFPVGRVQMCLISLSQDRV